MTVLVEIPTKNRDSVLGRCLAGLFMQAFQDFDILILNDGKEEVGRTPTTNYMLKKHRLHRKVWVETGTKISQAHNHNIPLYDKRFAEYKFCLRVDDDVVLNRRALQGMVNTIKSRTCEVGAVAGLWFENERLSDRLYDRMVMDSPIHAHPSMHGIIGTINSNWQQRVYHPTGELYRVEHLYSVCLYNMEAMRIAGGWPEVYSRGVAHGEETDGTYRLHLSGKHLIINPAVTGEHLRAGGGIRDVKDLKQVQSLDREKWQNRLSKFQDINFQDIKVAVECKHSFGIGGAERMFYSTVFLLQALSNFIVHPIFHGLHYSPERCKEIFGFAYLEPDELLDEYDVLIVLGHEPEHKTVAKHKIFICLFPLDFPTELLFKFDQVFGISKYVAGYMEEKFKVTCGHIYPPVIWESKPRKKENIILVVGRCVPSKSLQWQMERFVELGLTDWKMHIVTATSVDEFKAYQIAVEGYAEQHGIILHKDISGDELASLYCKSKILWSAMGMRGSDPVTAEHFGYTPVEAQLAGCAAVVYDRGGHKETVAEPLRWKTTDELMDITRRVAGGEPVVIMNLEGFSHDTYITRLRNYILRVNAMALHVEKIEQIKIDERPISVGLIVDSPYLPEYGVGITTGFAQIGAEIVRHLTKCKDIDLSVFTLMDTTYPRRGANLPYDVFPAISSDLQGRKTTPHFTKWCQPDVLIDVYDVGDSFTHVNSLGLLGFAQPIIGYFPIEGAGRLVQPTKRLIDRLTYVITWCRSGAALIREYIPDAAGKLYVAGIGIDHAPFAPLEPERRKKIRELVGWDDKFMCISVGSNKRTKMHPILVEAIRICLQRGYDDIYAYIHTLPFNNHNMGGWALQHIIDSEEQRYKVPVRHHVLLPPTMRDNWHGPQYEFDELEDWKLVTPPNPKGRKILFSSLSYIERLGIANLGVDPSSVEGWGLPILEMVACGLPAISVNDGMVRSEVHSKYCTLIDPVAWDTWHTGTRLAIISPEDLADAIIEARLLNGLELDPASMQLNIMEDLAWGKTIGIFSELVRKAYGESR